MSWGEGLRQKSKTLTFCCMNGFWSSLVQEHHLTLQQLLRSRYCIAGQDLKLPLNRHTLVLFSKSILFTVKGMGHTGTSGAYKINFTIKLEGEIVKQRFPIKHHYPASLNQSLQWNQ